jgi:2-dehydro-3-deoxygluconokinase
MNKSERAFELLKKNRLIALLTPASADQCLGVYEALEPAGVLLEVAFRTGAAAEGIRKILAAHPQALVLAGTIMTKAQAEEAMSAGAAGIVSADFIPEVVDVCARADVMCIPGGLSDAGKQLTRKAEAYGCSLGALREERPHQWIYKLFPAFTAGSSNIGLAEAWRGPFKGLIVVYTGGVSLANLAELNARDPSGIFCGSALTAKADDPAEIRAEAERWLAALRPAAVQKTVGASRPAAGKRPVVTFGEIMLRLSPPGFRRFLQASSFEAGFGGAEANVAVFLARLGLSSTYVTALPTHEIGQAAVDALRAQGVDTYRILRQGRRVGVYFSETGASQRSSKVIYDRADSAVSQTRAGSFDWPDILRGAAWFHCSGITPALSDGAAAATAEAVRAAKVAGATVSFDLNFRKKLWSGEKARAVLTPLLREVDIVFGNEEDAADIFGISAPGSDAAAGRLDLQGYRRVAEELLRLFNLKKVLLSLRESRSASVNGWSACLFDGKDFHHSRTFEIRLVDRIGGGDALAGAFIYATLSGLDDRKALEFAAAASCLKQTIPGDFNLVSREEIEALAAGPGSGRVQR